MGKKEADPNAELDADGLVVHKYVSTVCLVLPPEGYAETTMRYARSALYNVHVATHTVSTLDEGFLKGALQDELQADGKLSDVHMSDFSGVIFCGGPGAKELVQNPDAQRLAREASEQDKLLAAWGEAVGILAAAGVVRKRKITGDPALAQAIEAAGGRYTGVQVQRDGKIITGLDDAAGFRFGKALVQVVSI